MKNHLTSRGSGFTLIELLVTISVLAILLAIAVPSFQTFILNNRLATATNELVSALAIARSEAVKRATRVTVCKSANAGAANPVCSTGANWQDGWIVFVDGGVTGTIDGTDAANILRIFQPAVNTGMTITVGNNFADWMSYLPGGSSRGATGLANDTFVVSFATCPAPATNMARNVAVSGTGRVVTSRVNCV